MAKVFQYDSPFMRAMSRLGDLVWLNILFLLCSIPIFTAGAAYTALDSVLLAIMRKEEGYLTRAYFTAFKNNLRKITPIWSGMLLTYLVLLFDLNMLARSMNQEKGIIFGILCVALFLLASTNIYTFALATRFENKMKHTVKNAFLLGISQFFITVMMIVVIILPFVITYYSTYFLPVAMLFGFSGPAYINAYYFNRLFGKVEKNMSDKTKEILFLQPVLKEAVWGGKRLGEDFGYRIPSEHTGEAWVISAHQNGDCIITDCEYKGMTLSSLFESKRELFGGIEGDRFPLLIKIIDAKQDLSIQVHPGDTYAAKNENGSFGKTECWYVLDCSKDATIVIGHNAKTKDEMKQMIEEGRWSDFIREIPVKKGDFFQIEPGCLHAIKGGTMLLETQQNSDITYRIYDYDREYNGAKRELHIKKGMDVIKTPFVPVENKRKLESGKGYTMETLIECKYYKVCKLDLNGEINMKQDSPFVNVSIIDGYGKINDISIKKGDNFILPSGFGKYKFRGYLSVILSTVG